MNVLLLPLLLACCPPATPIGVETLLPEMTDLARLTRPADYTTKQFSSFDRGSLHGDWFANGDCGNYLRQEGDQWVLAEAKGPGAIVRLWSANPAGVLRITLDGAVALEADFLALLSGKVEPFTPPLGAMRSHGGNLYFPIPYARSMKVTCSLGGQYYHVDYRTYAEGTPVTTFDRARLPLAAIERSRSALLDTTPAVGRTVPLGAIDGPGTIVSLDLTVEEGAQDPRLREAVIHMTFDDELCVSAPLIDFFGTGPTAATFRTLLLAGTKEGKLTARFPMPFARSARIAIEAPDGIRVAGTATVAEGACGPFHFHAWWHGTNALKTRPFSDWRILEGQGQGRYVGTTLALRNPVRAWWGEGDEKVYVDGEKFPGIFGTGTEDYFGYAWSSPELFTAPYHSQSRCDGPATRGQTAVNRFHVLDDIPFTRDIRFDLEVWHWADCSMGYATTAYWYAEPGFKSAMKEGALEDRRVIPLPVSVLHVPGAIEGETLKVLSISGGVAERQDMSGFGDGWSDDAQLWWRSATKGDVLSLGFTSPFAGAGRLVLALTKARDYGIVKISLNGKVVATEDLYSPEVVAPGERVTDATFKAGENELTVEITGTNPKANPVGYMFALDYVRVVAPD
jgi:hypothetical protein